MKCICKQCGKEFELSKSEIDFYRKKKLNLPKRCKECRQANKQKKGDIEKKRMEKDNIEKSSMEKGGAVKSSVERGDTEKSSVERGGAKKSSTGQNYVNQDKQKPYIVEAGNGNNRVGKWVYVLIAAVVLLFAGLAVLPHIDFTYDYSGVIEPVYDRTADSSYISTDGPEGSTDTAQSGAGSPSEVIQGETEGKGAAEAKQSEAENAAAAKQGETDSAVEAKQGETDSAVETRQGEAETSAEAKQSEPEAPADTAQSETAVSSTASLCKFRSAELMNEHFQKHGIDMGFSTAEEYQAAASAVVTNPNALHKLEAEDGDDVYYLEASNEFVIVSTDGYIRTYFYPDNGIEYYNRQ